MEIYKSFDKKQKRIILISIALSIISIIAGFIYDLNLENEETDRIVRPKPYEDTKSIDFKVDIDGIENGENISYIGNIESRKLAENEIDSYLKLALDNVEKNMFREGEKRDKVLTGVDIPARMPGNPVDISFSTSESGILTDDGSINFNLVKNR